MLTARTVVYLPLAVAVLSALPLLAQTPALTGSDIEMLLSVKIADDVIVSRAKASGKPVDLSTEDLIRLKKAGASDNLIRQLLTVGVAGVTGAPTPVSQGLFSAPGASGATPQPGSLPPTGDPNDPMVPHDSGIYLYTKDRDGKPQLVVLERAGYQGTKTGGFFTSAMTYGIKKVKSKAVIPGMHASIKVTDASPVFYFYFDDKSAGLGKSMFGIGSLSNPNQFALLKLEIKSSNRETLIAQFGAFSHSSGTDSKSMIPFTSERVRPGLYKVTVNNLQPGEYCFLASSGVGGAMGAGATTAVDIFDFAASTQ